MDTLITQLDTLLVGLPILFGISGSFSSQKSKSSSTSTNREGLQEDDAEALSRDTLPQIQGLFQEVIERAKRPLTQSQLTNGQFGETLPGTERAFRDATSQTSAQQAL